MLGVIQKCETFFALCDRLMLVIICMFSFVVRNLSVRKTSSEILGRGGWVQVWLHVWTFSNVTDMCCVLVSTAWSSKFLKFRAKMASNKQFWAMELHGWSFHAPHCLTWTRTDGNVFFLNQSSSLIGSDAPYLFYIKYYYYLVLYHYSPDDCHSVVWTLG